MDKFTTRRDFATTYEQRKWEAWSKLHASACINLQKTTNEAARVFYQQCIEEYEQAFPQLKKLREQEEKKQ